jgi:hypothetical protein
MNTPPSTGSRILAVSAGLLLSAWGVVGVFGPRDGFTGALFAPDYTIPYVESGRPLDQAGFQAGDSVVAVEGIPVEELGMYSRWPRSLARQPGESLTMTVVREGALVDGEVVFGEYSRSSAKLQAVALGIGLLFLWGGVLPFLLTSSPHGTTLLAMGLSLGLAFPGPDVGTLNGIRDNLQQACMVLWALLLLRLSLTFPRRKRVMTGPISDLILFLPWVILLGCLLLELLFHPRFYHTFGWYTGALILLYLALATLSTLHTLGGYLWRRVVTKAP